MFSTRHLHCLSGVQRTKPYDEREARVNSKSHIVDCAGASLLIKFQIEN